MQGLKKDVLSKDWNALNKNTKKLIQSISTKLATQILTQHKRKAKNQDIQFLSANIANCYLHNVPITTKIADFYLTILPKNYFGKLLIGRN